MPHLPLQVSSMTRTGRFLIALPVLAMTALAPAVANAQFYHGGYGGYRGGYGGGYGGYRGGYGGGYGYRGYGGFGFGGALLGGAILGLGVGALAARPYYAPPVYYAAPPVVYALPPVYYAPAYGYR
jgi:hypothetical protein